MFSRGKRRSISTVVFGSAVATGSAARSHVKVGRLIFVVVMVSKSQGGEMTRSLGDEPFRDGYARGFKV